MEKLIRFILMTTLLGLLTVPMGLGGCNGTETGNPGTPQNNPGSNCLTVQAPASQTIPEDPVADLIVSMCQKLLNCTIVPDLSSCETDILSLPSTSLLAKFGPSSVSSFESLRSLIQTRTYEANSTVLTTCENDFLALECSSLQTQVTSNTLEQLQNLIPTSCLNTFVGVSQGDNEPTNSGCD